MGLLAAYVFASPLIFATVCLLVVGQVAQGYAVSGAAAIFLFIPLLAGVGLSVLYRWCFSRPAERGASLLMGAAVIVFLLSDPSAIFSIASLLMGSGSTERVGSRVVDSIGVVVTFSALACAVIMLSVLLVELPFRILSPKQRVVDDGLCRALRWIGVLVVFVIGSSIFREEGLARLGYVLGHIGG